MLALDSLTPTATAFFGQMLVLAPEPAPPQEYGPLFAPPAASDTAFPEPGRREPHPVLSVGEGAFCFVDGTHCKSALLASASVGLGVRIPQSNVAPELPYAQFSTEFGGIVRPMMLARRTWHPWGLGVIGSWSRGSGAAMNTEDTSPSPGDDGEVGDADPDRLVGQTRHTDAWRIALFNRLWLSQRPYAAHLDFAIGTVHSDVLTTGRGKWGTHAEAGFGWTGWGSLFVSADFLDSDTRLVAGVRGHAIAAAPIVALVLVGLAAGGAL